MNVIPFPKFEDIGRQATEGVPVAQLLWMALSQLTTHPNFHNLTPKQTYEKMKSVCMEVYE